MNERIRELAWSIGIAGKNLQGQIDTDWNQIEKFAELIVRECARISDEEDCTWTGQGAASAEMFKKYFGVDT